MRPFGYHIKGGMAIGSSLKATVDLGFTAAQIFLGPPQKPVIGNISTSEIDLFMKVKAESGVKVFCHAPYILHAFANPDRARANNLSLVRFLNMSQLLNLDGFVLHMGGTKWYDTDESDILNPYLSPFNALIECLDTYLPDVPLLLENCASGNVMSGDLQVICDLIATSRHTLSANIGLCLDTCHAWAWGYDWADGKYDTPNVIADLVRPFIQLIHLNSAPEAVKCGGKYDRHASIAKGVIPPLALAELLRKLPDVPVIVERDSIYDVTEDRNFVGDVDAGLIPTPEPA